MKKKHATLLAFVCIAVNSTYTNTEQTNKQPIVKPKDFTGMAQLTERIGTTVRYGTIPTLYALLAKKCIDQNKMCPALVCTSLAIAPAAASLGEYLLNYPQSRWDIHGAPKPHEETGREWFARKMRNTAAHIGNQGLKIGTVALPIGVAIEWILFKETYASKSPIVRTIFAQF